VKNSKAQRRRVSLFYVERIELRQQMDKNRKCLTQSRGRGHLHPAISTWHAQAVGIHSLIISFGLHHTPAVAHMHNTISTGNIVRVRACE